MTKAITPTDGENMGIAPGHGSIMAIGRKVPISRGMCERVFYGSLAYRGCKKNGAPSESLPIGS